MATKKSLSPNERDRHEATYFTSLYDENFQTMKLSGLHLNCQGSI